MNTSYKIAPRFHLVNIEQGNKQSFENVLFIRNENTYIDKMNSLCMIVLVP